MSPRSGGSARLLMSGNEAIAQGALDAGCTFYAGYPITPQNELIGYMAQHMPAKNRTFIQAESELGAINMVFGAAAAGARAMTSSSSPGMSLKQEGISYLAGAQLPAVIVNIMRGGPGLGNIAPAQSDYFQATRGGGHGDYHCVVLAPSSVQEAYDLMPNAFDAADKYRLPVIVLGDGILGQMMEPLVITRARKRRAAGRRKPWALTGCRGRKPNIARSFFLNEGALEKYNLALQKKYALIRSREQKAELFQAGPADVVIIAYGTMARVCRSAVIRLRTCGKRVGLLRPVTLWPFPEQAVKGCMRRSKKVSFLVVELSYGQMLEDVRLVVNGAAPVHFLGRAGGGVPTEEEVMKRAEELCR